MKTKINGLLITIHLIIVIVLAAASAQQSKSDLSKFLLPAKFINSSNPKIIDKAKELTEGCKTAVEKAKKLFEFVRDSYKDNSCESFVASRVLECGGNSCRQRSILLSALCRAVEVPARLHLQKVTIRDFKLDNEVIRDVTLAHGITGIYLNGHWR